MLVRHEDISGVSGVGVVAEGVVLSTGKVVIHWISEHPSIVIWDSLEDALMIHGHQGATVVEFTDEGQAAD